MDLSVALVLKAIDQMSAPLVGVSNALKKTGESAKALGESWQKTGEKVSQMGEKVGAFAEKAKALITSILAPANDLETAMAELSVAFPDREMLGSLDRVRQAGLAWSQEHTQSAAQYVSTAKLLMQAGIGEAHAVEATAAALQLATAVGGDTNAVARTLGVVFAQMGDKTREPVAELGRLSDALARAKQLFPSVDVAALTDPLKDAMPAAKNAGVSFEQLIATLGQLNKAGLQGGEAGAQLAKVIQAMGPASTKLGFGLTKTSSGGLDLVASLQQLEAKFGSVDKMSPEVKAKLEAAFGPDVWKALTGLIGQTGDLGKALGQIQSSAGAAASAQQTLEATTASQAKISEHAIDALKIELAAGLAPALQELVPMVREGIGEMTKFAKANPELVKTAGKVLLIVAAVASVAGPVLVVGGAIVTFAGFIMATLVPALAAAASGAIAFAVAMLANPITWIVLAIVAAVALIYIYWTPISGFFLALWAKLEAGFRAVVGVFTAVWRAAYGAVTSVFDEVKAAFQVSFVGGMHAAFQKLNPGFILGRVFAAVIPIVLAVMADIVLAIVATGVEVWKAVAAWWHGVLVQMHAYGAEVRAVLKAAWVSLRTDIVTELTAAMVWLEQVFVGGVASDLDGVLAALDSFSLANAGEKIVNTLVTGMTRAATAPADAMAGIVQKVRDYLPFSPAKTGPLKDLNRIRLVETVAESMNPAPLVQAMGGVTSAAYETLSAPVPPFAPVPLSVSRRDAVSASAPAPAAAAAPAMNVTFQLGSGAANEGAVEQLEAWLRNPSNARRLYRAAQVGAGLEQRTELA